MAQKHSKTWIIVLVIVIGIASLLYSTYNLNKKTEEYKNYHKVETFMNYSYDENVNRMYDNSLENYKEGLNYNTYSEKTNYQDNIQLFDVKKDHPMITYGCIQSKLSENLFEDLNKMFFVTYHEFYALTIDDIYQQIVQDLNNTLSRSTVQTLEEPVFVVIFQAPYLYFNNEQVVARHDVVNNMKPSYEQNVNDVTIGHRKLFTKLLVIYPSYTSDLQLYNKTEGVTKFHEYFKPKMSRNKLCFLECNKMNPYACGCLNREQTDNTNDFYKSTCIEYTGEKFDYGMIYSLNKFNPLFSRQIRRNSIIM